MTIPPPPTEPPAPPITDAMRARARANPGKWMYEIDPAFDPNGAVPPWGIKGGWEVDQRGDLVRWVRNPNYRPSPRTLGMYQPENPAEAALQNAATGYGPEEALLTALLDTPLAVLAHPQRPGLYVEPDPDSRGVVTAYTSPRRLPTDWPGYQLITGRQLAAELPGGLLRLNPTARPSVTLPLDEVGAAGTSAEDRPS
ncbi:type VII secretion system-associated protein [Kitasatospora sp. NPDC056181]|uniref:type VII secretion system-associated protein n=1 Tax=Kitasatospora sp. NPDC056181 TaxID=3345737 RepID=UPI0035DF0A33